MGTIMKKLAIMKKPMIAISSKRDGGAAPAWRTPIAAPGSRRNQYERFCCRFAAGVASRNNPFNL